MSNKNDYKLYLLSVENRGKTLNSKEVLKIFGYATDTYINKRIRVRKYLEALEYKHPRQFWKIKSLAALKYTRISDIYSPGGIHHRLKNVIGTSLFLIPRKDVPFWLLKEYGGKII